MAATTEEIEEYRAQLVDVEGLLKESPHDASLLSLKSDLMELLEVSGATFMTTAVVTDQAGEQHDGTTKAPVREANGAVSDASASFSDNALDQALKNAVGSSIGHGETAPPQAAVAEPVHSKPVAPPVEKKKKVKTEFEIPKHLEISESDTTAEKNKKKRAIKALKSKWKESVKEVESEKKQKSWQSFQKKRNVKGDSIFKTGDTAVGVVSAAGRKLTDFEDRKRHKHDPPS